MASLSKIGPALGYGGRAHVFEATTTEGALIALKAYHAKAFLKKELAVYEYLSRLGRYPMYLPKFHGPICLTPDNIRKIESSMHVTRGKTGAAIFRIGIGIGIERVEGLRLCDLINDMPDEELKDFEEKMLAALLDLHNGFEICHKDIKADNILLPRSLSSRSTGFVVNDLSEAIIRKYTLDAVWKKACKDDIQALREIFMDARSAKIGAVIAGCQLIQKATSIPQPSGTSDAEISNHLSNNLQVQLSHLLKTARGHDTVSLLVDSILSTIKDPIRPLAMALVRTLQSIARLRDALCIIDSCSAARSNEFDSTLIPSFKFQKAKILGSLHNIHALEHFDSALLGFEAQLGPDHITTQLCRYELALQHAGRDLTTAITILASLAKTIASRRPLTKNRKWLLRKVKTQLQYFRSLDNFHKTLPKSTPISGSQKRPLGNSLIEASPPAKRSRVSQEHLTPNFNPGNSIHKAVPSELKSNRLDDEGNNSCADESSGSNMNDSNVSCRSPFIHALNH